MLSEKLKARAVLQEEYHKMEVERREAMLVIKTTARAMVTAIRLAEADGLMTRTEAENYALHELGRYEGLLYSLKDDEINMSIKVRKRERE